MNPIAADDRPSGTGDADVVALIAMICGSWTSRAIVVATRLRLADLIASGDGRLDTLARDTGSNHDALGRLLRALCSLGLCRESTTDTFALTPTGLLLSDDPSTRSLSHFVTWWDRYLGPVWSELGESVQTGWSARKRKLGHERFENIEADLAAAAAFDCAMGEITQFVAADVAKLFDDRALTVVDVGGGNGALLLPLLEARTALRGVVYDLASATDLASERIESRRLGARCTAVAGDFFESVPEGGHVYLLKSILHDWDDQRCGRVLGSIRRAIGADGRLIVVERVLPDRIDDNAPCREILRNDLNMLVAVGGRERTSAEYEALLARHGFELAESRPLPLYYSALMARPV